MDVEKLAKELILKNMTPEQQMAVLEGIKSTVAEAKEVQKRKIGENVDIVVQALKKIEADIRSRYDDVGNAIEKRVASIKDGRDGKDGKDGRDGKDGKAGRDGAKGDKGDAGRDGRDGVDGVDGVSVTSARIDFDGSLIIVLSSGVELNVGEVVAPDLAERIKVITNGGGTSQSVLDTLASLQTQINNLIPSQTGNSGKFLTTNGSALSWASVAGGLSYQGTWNASTNTPTLASSTGINGYYYIVATAGSTNLNGITDWQVGDWLLFNGTVWQKIDQSETLQTVTSADGSLTISTVGSNVDLSVARATNVVCQVRNTTGATLTKGTAVYISGATGQIPTVSKAQANSDATSAQTLGLMSADLANNTNGYVTVIGLITDIDTSAYTDGAQLYLSGTTAGALTATKPYAPTHLVYVAVVEHSHITQGKLFVKVQNGYEMDELHNVSAQSPSNGQTLIYNTSTSLWEKANLTAGTAIGVSNGAGSITINNTGVTSAIAGTGISVSGATGAVTITNSAPDQTVALTSGTGISTSGTYPNFTITNSAPDKTVSLTGAGTTSVTGTYPNFTITSNDAYTGTVTSVTGTSPVASSGGTTPAISLAASYGDTQNPYASKTANFVLAAPNGSAGVPTFRAIVAADIPTLNQNTTGTASNVTGTVAIANGGSGQTTAQLAMNAFAGAVTSGSYLRGNGTNVVMSAIQAGDIPTLNQNTTGTASNVTGTIAVANGGTGLTSTPTNGQLDIGNGTGFTRATLTGTASQITVTNGSGSITLSLPSTINVNTSGSAASLSSTLAIASGGTGQTTANAAFNALAPSQATNSGKYLTTDGTNTSWATVSSSGTVTSVAATVPSFLSVSGSPITTSGTLAISYSGTALPIANGGTGQTTASAAFNALSPITSTGDLILGNGINSATRLAIGTNGYVLTSNGTTASWQASTGGGGISWQSVQTTNFTAVSGNGYPVNTTSSAITVTLPASPSAGNYIYLLDYAGTFATNNLTISGNGNKFNGSSINAKINTNRESIGIVYIDATQGWIPFDGFNTSTPDQSILLEYLVVAGGGGGGGDIGGGGGAGGYRTASSFSVNANSTHTVTVGGGGAGATGANAGTAGGNSVFSTITSTGGGGGAKANGAAGTGGSGGGGGWSATSPTAGGAGTSGQGNNGGTGGTASPGTSGGGGGSSANGATGSPASTGNGGAGTASSISSSSVTYAGGGGGGGYNTGGATGGSGGGGNGGRVNDPGTVISTPTAGSTNTGSGGGGGGAYSQNGAAGGSGIVIIRYLDTYPAATSTTGSPTITVTGGYRIYKWTGSGSITF